MKLFLGGYVNSWEWECFEDLVTSTHFNITDCGPLRGPVTKFSIVRDESLQLVLETTSEGCSTSSAIHVAPGTVYVATDQVKLESRFGSSAIAHGVIPYRQNGSWSQELPTGETRETSSVHALEWDAQRAHEPRYTIEWFENMPGSFIWPDNIDEKTTGETRRTFRSPKEEIVISLPINSGGGGRSCVHISVGGVDLFAGALKNIHVKNISNPGFILYKGSPSEDIRSKIRDCLSFAFGTYLIYLGCISFDDDWEPVSFKAVTADALSKDDHRLIAMLPAPLGLKYQREITSEMLERLVVSLYHNYDAYHFKRAFWGYWHAIAAPIHMAAIHFGAAIEALKKAYVQHHHASIRTSILDKASWNDFHKNIETCIASLDVSPEQKKLLSNKISNLNSLPQGIVMEQFLDEIKIKVDVMERSAWENRNHAAHGGVVNEDNHIKTIRENKALLVLMNRILLAISCGSDYYYDYYTLGYPISRLTDPIPNDKAQ